MAKAILMGILNVTPDSFFDQGSYFQLNQAIERGIKIYDEGADIIDIGGESTRPNASLITEEEEISRVIPVIRALKVKLPIPISVDTMKVEVARQAIEEGASLINDVSGLKDIEMVKLAAKTGVKICLMHMKGTPLTMQNDPNYPSGVVNEILQFFKQRIKFLLDHGVQNRQIILDPGIGFGKSIDDNLEIIHNLHRFKEMGYPLLLGISRKSFMSKIVNQPTSLLLPVTIGLNAIAIMSKTDMIRVHDVKEHRMVINFMEKYMDKKQ